MQKQAGCIIGVDYPKPIVDHKIVSKENMNKIKAAYDEHKLLASGYVEFRDGSWLLLHHWLRGIMCMKLTAKLARYFFAEARLEERPPPRRAKHRRERV